MFSVERYHDFSAGHRVVGHEGKCQHLHGHNYRVHFTCVAESTLDDVGRVIDFGVIKSRLSMWLEEVWDHKMLLWNEDPLSYALASRDSKYNPIVTGSIVVVPFNPTAENMAQFLVETVGPAQLKGTSVVLQKVRVEETRKCSATYERTDTIPSTVEKIRQDVEYLKSKDEID